ncbi:MAG TPA: TonB family protein, partial [Rubricoccaceae bacterium]
LQAERDAARRAGTRSGSLPGRNDAADARAASLAAEVARLRAERDQLVVTRDRATTERARLAADLDAARLRGESADAAGQPDRARLAEAEAARLRAEIVARDQTLAALRVESEDRRIRLAETDAELARTQRALLTVTAERDVAQSERDIVRRELAGARTGTAAASRLALLSDRADLDAARARFEAERAAAAQNPSAVSPADAALLAERQRSLDGLAAVSAERDALALQVAALQAERDRLNATVGRLASDLSAERLAVAQRRTDTAQTAVLADRADWPASGRPIASFPGFDFSRLANPDLVRRRVDEAEYPDWAAQGGIEGDVLVLFQTDASGRVVRAAVATPIGGGLDALAESLVRDMVFVPPVVNGLATGLRSQVLVRFSRS